MEQQFGQKILDLFPPGPALNSFANGVAKAIQASFISHPMRNKTRAEVQRRFNMAKDIALQLRGDLKWPVQRIADHLTEYLRNELDGVDWKPDDRRVWITSDGTL